MGKLKENSKSKKDAILTYLSGSYPDTLSKNKAGNWIARKSYFWTPKEGVLEWALRLTSKIPNCELINSGNVWKAFKGKATIAQQSHYWVEFKIKHDEK